jgi:hypothetical protein
MLDAHAALAIPPETGFVPVAADLDGSGDDVRARFMAVVVGSETWPDLCIDAGALHAAIHAIEPFTVSGAVRAFYRLYAARFGKPRWGDKTPTYSASLDRIRRVLPEARFIHLIRDGRDVALSLAPLWFAPGRDPETLARAWRTQIEAARRLGANRVDYLEVRYEALVEHPRRELARVCAFLDLPYDERMERWHETARERLAEHRSRFRPDGSLLISHEERVYNQRFTMRPPALERVFRWRREMDGDTLARFERVAGDLLETLGYARATAG